MKTIQETFCYHRTCLKFTSKYTVRTVTLARYPEFLKSHSINLRSVTVPVDERDESREDLRVQSSVKALECVNRSHLGAPSCRRSGTQVRARTRTRTRATGTAHGRRAAAQHAYQIVQRHPEQLGRPRRRLRADELKLASGTFTKKKGEKYHFQRNSVRFHSFHGKCLKGSLSPPRNDTYGANGHSDSKFEN